MSQKSNNGQKSTSSFEVVFNTAKGFAESGNQFEGNYKFEENKIYAKSLQFPGGKWVGVEALADIINFGVQVTMYDVHNDHTSEMNAENYANNCRKVGNSFHALRCAFMMLGADEKDAEELTIKYILDLDLGYDVETINGFLNNDLAAI